MATDLRASVAPPIAALAARCEPMMCRSCRLKRGFERLEQKLPAVRR